MSLSNLERGEVAKKAVGGAIEQVKHLRDRIQAKFSGNDRAITAFNDVKQQGTEAVIEKAAKYLYLEMAEDPAFATEIRQIAQEIVSIQNQSNTTLNQQNLNYGRDQNVTNQPTGDIKIGGS